MYNYVFAATVYTMYSLLSDLNECEVDNGRCEQVCDDLIPGYECRCSDGYRLEENGLNCTGILLLEEYSTLQHILLNIQYICIIP